MEPIEHRLFSEISKNWAGEPLDSYHKILHFIRSTKTQTGLSVNAHLDRRHYPTAQNHTRTTFRPFASGLTKPCPMELHYLTQSVKLFFASTLREPTTVHRTRGPCLTSTSKKDLRENSLA